MDLAARIFIATIATVLIVEPVAGSQSGTSRPSLHTFAYNILRLDGTLGRIERPMDVPGEEQVPSSVASLRSGELHITVNSNADTDICDLSVPGGQCTLRGAIGKTNAAGGGTIDFNLSGPTVIEVGNTSLIPPLVLNAPGETAIRGPGAGYLTIRAANPHGLFVILGSGTALLTGFTMENGVRPVGEGGCISAGGSSLTVDQVVIQNCRARYGGGISTRGTLFVTRSILRNNTSDLGGGIFVGEGSSSAVVSDSAIYGNTGQGGGINNNGYKFATLLTVTNSTITGNFAPVTEDIGGAGGGFFSWSPQILTNVTVANNRADEVGGGINDYGGTSRIRNAIVALNSAPGFPDLLYLGTSDGHNLIGVRPNVFVPNVGDILGTDSEPADPRLAPLADNGGPTPTMALLLPSPARDAGNNCVSLPGGCLTEPLTTDQRGDGYRRMFGASVDIGAYELQSALRPSQFDFDGDFRADTAVYRPTDTYWYISRSQGGFESAQFGLPTDKLTPGDYDGDGKADISVFRNGVWYWLASSDRSFDVRYFGQSGDVPVPGDFTGDGRTDLCIYRDGVWWSLDLANAAVNTLQFGLAYDKPVVADYDNDGRADQAVFRNGWWYVNLSAGGTKQLQFGLPDDIPVVGDYDGDGRADEAVYRSGTWYLRRSALGFTALQFGLASDVPVTADYDGDGQTDIAVFRDGVWYTQKSTQGFAAFTFGLSGDKPIPAAFVP